MKRFTVVTLMIFTCSLLLFGCGKKEKELTMDDFITAFENSSISVDSGNEPYYQMISAKSGVTFDYEKKVVIYEYSSTKDLNESIKENDFMKDWAVNGKFVLECSDEDVISIFNNVK
jgi:hypothetical protein